MKAALLTVGVADAVNFFRQHHGAEPEKFEDLEKCSDGYAELKKKYDDLLAECKPTPEPETTTTEAPTPATEPPPETPISKPTGDGKKDDGHPLYKPPKAESGKPSNEEGYDYKKHGDDWTAKFATCAAEEGQSPVNLSSVDLPGHTKSVLWFDYFLDEEVNDESKLPIRNAGHGIYADLKGHPADYGFVKLLKTEYQVEDFVMHTPAEHTIDGTAHPLEIQIYHKARDGSGKTLAVSVIFKEGETNKFLEAVSKGTENSYPVWTVDGAGVTKEVGGKFKDAFDLENLLPMGSLHPGGDLTWYNYQGSLTFPPCTGGVDWWVLKTPISATKEEIAAVEKGIKGSESTRDGNTRKLQTLGSRTVLVGHTGFQHHGTGHRLPGGKKFPRQPRGHNTMDHPWKPPKEAHWTEKAAEEHWKEMPDKRVVGSLPK